MKIDITSDVICPFCLIGVKQLLAAIDKYKITHPDAEFNIRFLPYELNSSLTEEPVPRKQFYATKFGEEKAAQILSMLPAKYEAVGCKCDLSGDISSTQLAHRLQTYALCHHPSAQLPLVLDVFIGFHSEAKHPSDKPWLSSLAVKHGIFPDEKAAREWLDGKQCDKEVKKAYGTARDLGVTGVPFFVFQDKYAASGAMGTEEFVQLLEEIDRREKVFSEKSAPPLKGGETCTNDGSCPFV
ncbi:hypothetical protein I352_02704 [Cryptococcus deuterogattii MMRL2647]|nr:hypothetical protein I352_02704 [Cryptococcus deuterogattii MMRL2647]